MRNGSLFRFLTAASGILYFALSACADPHVPVKRGLWKVFEYEQPDTLPIIVSGWSKAQDAYALEYCIYFDIFHSDGTVAWSRKVEFNLGTHDWEMAQKVVFPKKPVKKIEVHAIFRTKKNGEKARGTVSFRDFKLERREGDAEVLSTSVLYDQPYSNKMIIEKKIFNKREVKSKIESQQSTNVFISPLASGEFKVWTADSMELITPLTFPSVNASANVNLSLARRERESAQVLITTAQDVEWRAATLHISELKREDGKVFRGHVDWRRQGYLAREHGAHRHPYSFPSNQRWFPDPLPPKAPMRVRPSSTQGAWITVFAEHDALPGKYEGFITVRDGGREMARVPIAITVFDFSLPAKFGLETAFSVMDGFTKALYPEDYKKRKREAMDIMLDHRLNPDDISRTEPPDIDDLLYARDRGMNRFNILNIVPRSKDPDARWVLTSSPKILDDEKFYGYFIGVVKPYVEELKRYGLDDMAYVYGFDESSKKYNKVIERFWRRFKKDVPGIPVMTTAKNYQDFANGRFKGVLAGDWLCPTTDAYDIGLSRKLREEVKKVWWYVCCWPEYPYANFASWEYPPIEGRLLGWMTHLYRSDGLLFWIVNKWHGNEKFNSGDTYFPGYRTYNKNGMPGDGIMMYPGEDGIWPSIKLAQCRDGVEDYEYLQLVKAKFGVEKCDEITKRIVKSLTRFSRNPVELRAARQRLAELIVSGNGAK